MSLATKPLILMETNLGGAFDSRIVTNKAVIRLAGLSYPYAGSWPASSTMTEEALNRKQTPVFSGFVKYFPRAMREVARVSFVGNEQHHAGSPLHWDKSKSQDEEDAGLRHLMDHTMGNVYDTDGTMHLAKYAWRAMACLERYLEDKETQSK